MKIALIQSQVYDTNEKNMALAISNIASAAKYGADMVVLPEMFCCPYQNSKFPVFAQDENGENVQLLKKCAKENNVYLVAGSMPEKCGDKIYNTSYVFDKFGEKIAKHRKVQLFNINIKGGQCFSESKTLTDGYQVTVFDTEFGKLGLLICFDIRFEELSRIAALNGAKCIIYPASFNMTTGPLHCDLLFRARALDNQLYTVGVSPARDENGSYVAYGHSLVVSPWGEIVAQLGAQEDILYYDLDFSQVASIREQIPQILHRNTDLYTINYKNKQF